MTFKRLNVWNACFVSFDSLNLDRYLFNGLMILE